MPQLRVDAVPKRLVRTLRLFVAALLRFTHFHRIWLSFGHSLTHGLKSRRPNVAYRPQLNLLEGQPSSTASTQLSALSFSAFAFDDANPVGDTNTWTYVFVPYCTQDIHLGTCNQSYTDPVSGETRHMQHNGRANTQAVIDWVTASFPVAVPPSTLAFVGCSAGPAPPASLFLSRQPLRRPQHAVRCRSRHPCPNPCLLPIFPQGPRL